MANIAKLRESPEFANSGLKWSEDDDLYLMKNVQNKISYDKIATHLKRTVKSIEMRAWQNIIDNIDAKNTIEHLCNKFHVSVDTVRKYKDDSEAKELMQKEKKEAKATKDDSKPLTDQTAILLEIRDILLILAKNSLELSEKLSKTK
jgi:hypothetical protein